MQPAKGAGCGRSGCEPCNSSESVGTGRRDSGASQGVGDVVVCDVERLRMYRVAECPGECGVQLALGRLVNEGTRPMLPEASSDVGWARRNASVSRVVAVWLGRRSGSVSWSQAKRRRGGGRCGCTVVGRFGARSGVGGSGYTRRAADAPQGSAPWRPGAHCTKEGGGGG